MIPGCFFDMGSFTVSPLSPAAFGIAHALKSSIDHDAIIPQVPRNAMDGVPGWTSTNPQTKKQKKKTGVGGENSENGASLAASNFSSILSSLLAISSVLRGQVELKNANLGCRGPQGPRAPRCKRCVWGLDMRLFGMKSKMVRAFQIQNGQQSHMLRKSSYPTIIPSSPVCLHHLHPATERGDVLGFLGSSNACTFSSLMMSSASSKMIRTSWRFSSLRKELTKVLIVETVGLS